MTAPSVTSAEHAQLTSRAAALSVGVALILIGFKAWAWLSTSSVAMLASLADSTLDLAASLFTFFAVRYAAAPPDREHRFGHGKAESFAALLQGGLVVVSGALIALEAGRRFVDPQPITHGAEGIAVMVFSILLTGALVGAQTRAIARTNSIATRADRLHYAADIGSNFIVIVGLGAGAFLGLAWADAAAGLLVAAWLVWGALHVAGQAADHLLDRELPDEQRAQIRALAESDPRMGRAHDMRTRSSGQYIHIQFHADLDAQLTLEQAHEILVAAENRIRAQFPTADIIIHPDPSGRAEPHGHEHFERRTDGA